MMKYLRVWLVSREVRSLCSRLATVRESTHERKTAIEPGDESS
jgi:hypothetical protein